MSTSRTVLVSGDLVQDYHIYQGDRFRLGDDGRIGTMVVSELGGAALTQRLIQAGLDREHAASLDERDRAIVEAEAQGKLKPQPLGPPAWSSRLAADGACDAGRRRSPPRADSFALWKRATPASSAPGGAPPVWRVDRPLGYGTIAPWTPSGSKPDRQPSDAVNATPLPDAPQAVPSILVLDDAGAEFRWDECRPRWHLPESAEALATAPDPRWIVLKLGGPIGTGDLWMRLRHIQAADRLVIIASTDVLRLASAQLNAPLSWEQVAEQLVTELVHNHALKPLRSCRHLIVSFHHDGAMWVEMHAGQPSSPVLIFDPAHVEGEWCEHIDGEVFGYGTCLASAVVLELISLERRRDCQKNGDAEPFADVARAVERGLSAMRALRAAGHGTTVNANRQPAPGTGFPVGVLVRELMEPSHAFARALVPVPSALPPSGGWSIVESSQGPGGGTGRPLLGFARQIALRGEVALAGVPYLRIGRLLTASRQEMESFRVVKRLLDGYNKSKSRRPKPLSIGVFGAPGAGKSFGVRELATGLFNPGGVSYDGWMEFNLSQFDGPGDLIGAFHQVRDRVLENLVPVVFWDEFDSGNYKWLQYLLAPMQDGKFQEGQVTHPIGKCVFVFAGATAHTFDFFGPQRDCCSDDRDWGEAQRHWILAKGPDFKSRLDASINVLGPNRADGASAASGDRFLPARRAILLRGMLGCEPAARLDIDHGLLTALLEVSEYRHGARSLEKLLDPLKRARNSGLRVRRSQLAPPSQLDLYVPADEFAGLCATDEAFLQQEAEIVRAIAPKVHEVWREIAGTQGWTPKHDVAYELLPAFAKRSNEAAARRMPENLALVGLRLVRQDQLEPGRDVPSDYLKFHVELLAEAEHDGWVGFLLSESWRYGDERDDDNRVHDCLKPYRQLREKDRDKDREQVLHYPEFAREAGWVIMFAGGNPAGVTLP